MMRRNNRPIEQSTQPSYHADPSAKWSKQVGKSHRTKLLPVPMLILAMISFYSLLSRMSMNSDSSRSDYFKNASLDSTTEQNIKDHTKRSLTLRYVLYCGGLIV